MRFVLFYHSLISDWNHGNAHYLRGVVTELLSRGHEVAVYEPQDAWSVQNLVQEHGEAAVEDFHRAYPMLQSIRYDAAALDLEEATDGADVVIVHEWNAHDLVARLGKLRSGARARARAGTFRLLFYDTHHRAITKPEEMSAYDLSGYDGVLAFGRVLRELYVRRGWTQQAWTWHEAADVRIFRPLPCDEKAGDLVWVGNWGDEERTAELHEFLLEPIRALGLKAMVYGVRYPQHALNALEARGIEYGGWLPNYAAPGTFAKYRVTVHVPRRPYVQALPGIPTIRVFEALACGIPLVCSPWEDAEGLFSPGDDFLVARNGAEMQRQLRAVLSDGCLAKSLAEHGLQTILARHTCAHRVDELLAIVAELGVPAGGHQAVEPQVTTA